MSYPPSDTSREAAELLASFYLQMTPAQKLERVRQLTAASNHLALAGLRQRFPGEGERALLARLARMRLGEELYDRAYGQVETS